MPARGVPPVRRHGRREHQQVRGRGGTGRRRRGKGIPAHRPVRPRAACSLPAARVELLSEPRLSLGSSRPGCGRGRGQPGLAWGAPARSPPAPAAARGAAHCGSGGAWWASGAGASALPRGGGYVSRAPARDWWRGGGGAVAGPGSRPRTWGRCARAGLGCGVGTRAEPGQCGRPRRGSFRLRLVPAPKYRL